MLHVAVAPAAVGAGKQADSDAAAIEDCQRAFCTSTTSPHSVETSAAAAAAADFWFAATEVANASMKLKTGALSVPMAGVCAVGVYWAGVFPIILTGATSCSRAAGVSLAGLTEACKDLACAGWGAVWLDP